MMGHFHKGQSSFPVPYRENTFERSGQEAQFIKVFPHFTSCEPGHGCDDSSERSLEMFFGGVFPAWPEVWMTVMLILGDGIITQYSPFSQLFPLFAPGGCCGLEDQTKLLGLQA